MNQGPEGLSDLSKLLALKRHEQPPPGFFYELPDKICSRIEAEADRPESWWRRPMFSWSFRPALAGALALAAFGVHFLGMQVAEVAGVQNSEVGALAMDPAASQFPHHANSVVRSLAQASSIAPVALTTASSMNPVINPGAPAPVGLFEPGVGMKASPRLTGFSLISQ